MEFWLHEVIAPESILRNVTFFLLVVSIGMSSMLLLRVVALAAGIAGIVLSGLVVYDPLTLFWMSFFTLMNAVRLVLLRSRKFGRPLNKEEGRFHQTIVPELGVGQVRRLLTAGRWLNGTQGQVLTLQDDPARSLFYIDSGLVDIRVDDAKIGELGAGDLVGEIGISTGEPSTATVVCAGPVRVLEFKADRLYRLLDSHKDLLERVELAVQRSTREKLRRTNEALAHPGGSAHRP